MATLQDLFKRLNWFFKSYRVLQDWTVEGMGLFLIANHVRSKLLVSSHFATKKSHHLIVISSSLTCHQLSVISLPRYHRQMISWRRFFGGQALWLLLVPSSLVVRRLLVVRSLVAKWLYPILIALFVTQAPLDTPGQVLSSGRFTLRWK